MSPDLAISLAVTIGTAILVAGGVMVRVSRAEKDIAKHEGTGERVTKMEADVHHLRNLMQAHEMRDEQMHSAMTLKLERVVATQIDHGLQLAEILATVRGDTNPRRKT